MVRFLKKNFLAMTMAMFMQLTDVVVAMLMCYGMGMCRFIMRMGDKMRMNVVMMIDQCVRNDKCSARYHKKQAKEIHDCKRLSIYNECQKCSYKWRNRIICTRLCRTQVTLSLDIHKNTKAIRYKSKYHRQCHILCFR